MVKERRNRSGRWKFTAAEIRAVLLLLPVAAILVWIVAESFAPRFDDSSLLLGDTLATKDTHVAASGGNAVEPFDFDPNTVTYEELGMMGMGRRAASSMIKYREAGKVFRVPEDVASCYGISDSLFAVLRPYIVIGDEYSAKRNNVPVSGRERTTGRIVVTEKFDPNELSAEGFVALGFTPNQARAIINYRNSLGGFRTPEDFAASYVVSDEMFARLKVYININLAPEAETNDYLPPVTSVSRLIARPRVDINSADSATLVAVNGIGPATASAIIDYRRRLGGFHDIWQVTELSVVTERNWERMMGEICADSCGIKKIDINFAAPNAVAGHPYVRGKLLRRIMSNRQLKGGWSTIEDMIEDNTLTMDEARKLAPYLHFSDRPE